MRETISELIARNQSLIDRTLSNFVSFVSPASIAIRLQSDRNQSLIDRNLVSFVSPASIAIRLQSDRNQSLIDRNLVSFVSPSSIAIIPRALAILGREVDATPHTPARVRHDAQTTLEDRGDHLPN
jgi:hypothetical protein